MLGIVGPKWGGGARDKLHLPSSVFAVLNSVVFLGQIGSCLDDFRGLNGGWLAESRTGIMVV